MNAIAVSQSEFIYLHEYLWRGRGHVVALLREFVKRCFMNVLAAI